MATDQDFVDYLVTQSGLEHRLTYRRMFGEYAMYLAGKVVAFACNNQLFLKPTEEGRALIPHLTEAPPYPGAKMYFQIDDEIEDQERLRRLFIVTADVLPLPKPKAPRKAARQAASGTAKPPATKKAAKRAAKKAVKRVSGKTAETAKKA
jgi:TfoX/Sxy family transcriptional regulator of competence genes